MFVPRPLSATPPKPAKKKKGSTGWKLPPLKKWHYVAAGAAAAVLILAILVPRAISQWRTTVKVSATDLWQAYADDPQGASQKYRGKLVVVTGRVEEIPTDPKAPLEFFFVPPEKSEWRVQCLFNNKAELQGLKKDAEVTIQGNCQGQIGVGENVRVIGAQVLDEKGKPVHPVAAPAAPSGPNAPGDVSG